MQLSVIYLVHIKFICFDVVQVNNINCNKSALSCLCHRLNDKVVVMTLLLLKISSDIFNS